MKPCKICGARTKRAEMYGTCHPCARACGHAWGRELITTASGSTVWRRVCAKCFSAAGQWPKTLGGPPVPDVVSPSRGNDNRDLTPCARCGSLDGVEEHHWAPVFAFGAAADSWPRAMLCVGCHTEWHQTMERWRRGT